MNDVWIMLVGVSAGWVLSVFTPAVNRWLTKQQRRRALALLVCPVLDQFIADCQAAIDDEGEWHPSGTRSLSVPAPTGPEFPTGVDWTSIDPRLANRILSLPLAATRADRELDDIGPEIAQPPEHEEAFAFRREQCFKLLREASELAVTLRQMAKLPKTTDDAFESIAG